MTIPLGVQSATLPASIFAFGLFPEAEQRPPRRGRGRPSHGSLFPCRRCPPRSSVGFQFPGGRGGQKKSCAGDSNVVNAFTSLFYFSTLASQCVLDSDMMPFQGMRYQMQSIIDDSKNLCLVTQGSHSLTLRQQVFSF